MTDMSRAPKVTPLPIEDVQGHADTRRIPINKVGIKDIFHPVKVKDRSSGEQHTVANFNMYVSLPHNFKGTHMSRFVQILNAHEREITVETFQVMLREMVRGVIAQHAPNEVVRQMEDDPVGYPTELWEQFEAARPADEPHYYLSLLGTRSSHRGQGIGMALLEADLRQIDAEGAVARLESTNPANEPRYERAWFETVGSFTAPGGAPVVTTMRRAPR